MLLTTDNEVWKPVINFEGLYEVSNKGRIRAASDIVAVHSSRYSKANRILHHKYDIINIVNGIYYSVTLYNPNATSTKRSNRIYVHAAVSEAFQNYNDGLVVDHIDNNKHNNSLENLQRIPHRDNCLKSYANDESGRWSNRLCAVIRSDGMYYANLQEAIKDNNVKSNTAIINAIKRHTKCNGFYWKYADSNKQQNIDTQIRNRNLGLNNTSCWVRCIDTDTIMIHSDMLREFGVSDSVILDAITFHGGYCKYIDKTFEFVDESEIDLFSPQMQKYIATSTRFKKSHVMCKETGVWYVSMKQAAQLLNCSVDYVRDTIRKQRAGKYGISFTKGESSSEKTAEELKNSGISFEMK